MNIEIHENEERWYFNQKWIKSYFSFSYADYHNHKRPWFGKLLVLNEDHVQPGEWFPARPHKDMEIISIPLEWELSHKDSLWNDTIVKKSSVQSISTGKWISHSEFNGNQEEELKVLHIWIESENHSGEPRYEQKKYLKKDRDNLWQLLVSWNPEDEVNTISQDAYVSRISISQREVVPYKKRNPLHWVYYFVINGSIKLDSHKLKTKDAAGVNDEQAEHLIIWNDEESDVIAIEVPMMLKNTQYQTLSY
jgi:redox-sensitive bicupin YhaK (pirin superfamily)